MKIDWRTVRIFVRPGITDMRKQINGLSVLVQEEMSQDPLSGHLYLFCNGNRRRLKALYWDRNGFCLWVKRLERDRFPWPMNGNNAVSSRFRSSICCSRALTFSTPTNRCFFLRYHEKCY